VTADRPHESWIDTLRVAVIAGAIVLHVGMAYILPINWYYTEHTTSQVWPIALAFPALLGAFFGLGPLFFAAGFLSAGSLARRGRAAFIRARLIRLGGPLLVYVFVIGSLARYIGDLGLGRAGDFLGYFVPDSFGPMWFVAALLAISLAYAVLRGPRQPAASPETLRPAVLGIAALAIGVGSWAVWQVFPFLSQTYLDPIFAEWPQGAGLFALGVHAAETGWLDRVTSTLVRRLAGLAIAGLFGLGGLMALVLVSGQGGSLLSGNGWPAAMAALLDGGVSVTATVAVVAWLRRHWTGEGPLLSRAATASYATYVSHPLSLTILLVLLAPVALAPELKFVILAPVAVPACYAVGYVLTRLRPRLTRRPDAAT
jgi:hypothetical protein